MIIRAGRPALLFGPVAQLGERTVRIRKVVGSNPFRSTIKAKQYRCRRPEAYGINCFLAFSALKSIDSSIDANRCFPLTGGTRTPIFQQLAKIKLCGALFEGIIFKKGAVFHMQIFHEIEGAVLLVLMIIKAAPFFCSPQNQKGRQPKEVGKNEQGIVF